MSTKVAQDEHSWSPSSSEPLDTFLRKNKPTDIGKDGLLSWIRVQRLEGNDHSPEFAGLDITKGPHSTAIERGKEILEEYTKKIIEARRAKKTSTEEGTNSTAQTDGQSRKELAAEATEKLKQLALENKLTSGKWLFYPPERHINQVFARLARDLVNGGLSKTPAFAAKASTGPLTTSSAGSHMVCLYMPDLYNEEAVAEVLRVASRSIGIRANSAKLDLYTLIGLSRNHPSGIKSTTWRPNDLVPAREINELTSQYWDELRGRMVDA